MDISPISLTYFSLVGFSVLWQLDELFGEHAAAVAQDVAFQLDVRVGADKLQDDGVAGGVDPNLHVLSSYYGEKVDSVK